MTEFYQKINMYRNLPFQLTVFNQKTENALHLYPLHWHNCLEISATVYGKGKALIDGKEYRIENRNVFIIGPNIIHRIEGFFPYEENTGYCLQIELSYFEKVLPDISDKYYTTCSKTVSDEIIQQLILLENEIHNNGSCFDLIIRIMQILKILNQNQADHTASISDKNKQLILNIADYIEKNYTENLSLNTLSTVFNFSQSYLQKLFRKNFRQSVHQYITERRLIHAIDDLKYTDLSSIDIALKNGFASSHSFINEFKKSTGMTPGEYRKKL